jgi:uncharacterized integral membrane protein
MKTITNLLASLILAGWVGAIAILSVQNATLVSLKFLVFQSIQVPVGVVLAFSAGVGFIGGAVLPLLWQLSGFPQGDRQSQGTLDDDEDF